MILITGLIWQNVLFAGEYGKIDYAKGEKTVEMLLEKLAKVEVSIKNRLKELCDFS